MVQKIQKSDIEQLLQSALFEDIGGGDITSISIFSPLDTSQCRIVSKDDGIFCGKDIVTILYEYIDSTIQIKYVVEDGTSILPGSIIAKLTGPTIKLLEGERILLNFLQRLSGIATATAHYVQLLNGTNISILDTRKTLPGYRILDKYAVTIGGGSNHRMGLFDMILIKDNHIKAAGGIKEAIQKVIHSYGTQYKIEVETNNLDEVKDALLFPIDIIMLDNMSYQTMQEAILLINKKTKIEVSGNITEERLVQLRNLDIDYLSVGSLTHSVKAFDISMKFD